ncbi:uncharacterized protein MKK02DRAFT_44435 [Dioszegia hungarica]|uniref:Uncharacterized protein n=1 Tax=Dioszegia hungarica TaxID=4972 RepID=A0AA38H8K3_9TREE|nr:uncharacterized protein MKK02DRAFT_44435 [Dioszegia hungarica]KAI9635735.1 hypothetical protein MKK02DRAFT_44435 [Dioszegia hungarica]
MSASPPLAHLFVPLPTSSPSSSSSPSSPDPVTITTLHDHDIPALSPINERSYAPHDPSYNQNHSIPPIRPPRSPRRTPPKRLDAESRPATDRPRRYRNNSSLSLTSLEYVRTALRNFRASLPAARFPDKTPIRSPSRKYHRTRSPTADLVLHNPSSPTTEMSSARRQSQRRKEAVLAGLQGGIKTHERYGSVKEVRREGVGGHWRSYSTPPPSSISGAREALAEEGCEEGHKRVMSEGNDKPAPLRARPGIPIFDQAPHPADGRRASVPPPTLHIIHPSISTTPEDPTVYPPERISVHALHHPHGALVDDSVNKFATVVGIMDAGQAARGADGDDAVYMSQRFGSGRAQTARRNRVGPGGIISKIASRSSLSKLKIAFAPSTPAPDASLHPRNSVRRQPSPSPSAARHSCLSSASHRPAPLPPLLLNPTPNRFAPSSSRIPSPSPSATPTQSRAPTPLIVRDHAAGMKLNGIPPERSSMWGKEEGLVEIPRFKKRELNLGIAGGGLGQRASWGMLWMGWLIWGLLSLFFDVNVLYMLVQCAQNPSTAPDSASARTWVFAAAAFSVCWLISVFGVWIGWELCYEFWRRWRLPRPAIEPIHMSLPATLHLSLSFFQHFAFFLYVRLSPLRTPHSKDILPETAHLAIQSLPGLGPVLPRASLAVVLLVAFSSGDDGSIRDAAFWTPTTGRLTMYAHGVLLAFGSLTALRLLVVVLSAIILWAFSRPRRPSQSRLRSRFDSFSTSSPTDTRPTTPVATPTRRDPADTQSPSKGWIAESDLKWEWRERGRNRLQDAFELCMIRRPRSGAPSPMLRRQGVEASRSVGWIYSRQGAMEEKEGEGEGGEEMLSPTTADPFMQIEPSRSRSTIRFVTPPPLDRTETDETTRPATLAPATPSAVQARPESGTLPVNGTPVQPTRQSDPVTPTTAGQDSVNSLDPRSAVGLGGLAAARQSVSSQDLFYTPMSRTPATEKTRSRTELGGVHTESTSTLGAKGTGDAAALGGTSSSSLTPAPPSAYRPPPTPGPEPSTAGTSSTALHALVSTDSSPQYADGSHHGSASDKENQPHPAASDI